MRNVLSKFQEPFVVIYGTSRAITDFDFWEHGCTWRHALNDVDIDIQCNHKLYCLKLRTVEMKLKQNSFETVSF